jgi:hypothetical protein
MMMPLTQSMFEIAPDLLLDPLVESVRPEDKQQD